MFRTVPLSIIRSFSLVKQSIIKIHINGHDRTITVILANHCIELPDDGPLVIRNMLEQF